jgi:hypothetical protein
MLALLHSAAEGTDGGSPQAVLRGNHRLYILAA